MLGPTATHRVTETVTETIPVREGVEETLHLVVPPSVYSAYSLDARATNSTRAVVTPGTEPATVVETCRRVLPSTTFTPETLPETSPTYPGPPLAPVEGDIGPVGI